MVGNAAIFVTDDVVHARLIEDSAQCADLAGQHHHVDVCVLNLETVLDVSAGDIKGHFSALGNHNRIGVKGPGLCHNVRFILAGGKLAHTRVGKGAARRIQRVRVNPPAHTGHLNIVGNRGNRNGGDKDCQEYKADANPDAFPALYMQGGFLYVFGGRTVFAHCVTPRESMSR